MNVSVELLNKILNYLGTKPFVEVHQIIGEIMQLKEDTDKKPEKPKVL